MFENGTGVETDIAQATEWYQKAAAQGFSAASARLDALQPPGEQLPTTAAIPTTDAPAEPERPAVASSRPSLATSPTPSVAPSTLEEPINARAESGDRQSLQDSILLWTLGIYVLLSSYAGWRLVRPKILNWYRSGWWVVRSSGRSSDSFTGGVLLGGQVGEVFFKQIVMRLQVEGLALTLGVVVGCLGGNIAYVLKRRKEQRDVDEYIAKKRQEIRAMVNPDGSLNMDGVDPDELKHRYDESIQWARDNGMDL
jgi:hypothetical protein